MSKKNFRGSTTMMTKLTWFRADVHHLENVILRPENGFMIKLTLFMIQVLVPTLVLQ